MLFSACLVFCCNTVHLATCAHAQYMYNSCAERKCGKFEEDDGCDERIGQSIQNWMKKSNNAIQ